MKCWFEALNDLTEQWASGLKSPYQGDLLFDINQAIQNWMLHIFLPHIYSNIRHVPTPDVVYVGAFLRIVMLFTMLAAGKDISQNRGNGNTCRRKQNWHSLISICNIKVNNLNLPVDIQSKFIINPFFGTWENFGLYLKYWSVNEA